MTDERKAELFAASATAQIAAGLLLVAGGMFGGAAATGNDTELAESVNNQIKDVKVMIDALLGLAHQGKA